MSVFLALAELATARQMLVPRSLARATVRVPYGVLLVFDGHVRCPLRRGRQANDLQ